jgi:phage portal protein BeeE
VNLWRSLTAPRERSGVSLDAIAGQIGGFLSYNGTLYPLNGVQQTLSGTPAELPDQSYLGYVQSLYKADPIVYACMRFRMNLFSEARLQWQQMRNGQPGQLFGTQGLAILERPWPNGTTGDLLAKAISDVDLAGNFYCVRDGDTLRRLRPDWVSIILGSKSDPKNGAAWDVEVIGYEYKPRGQAGDTKRFLVEEVCHFAPSPDPAALYRGMSWLEPAIRDIMGDKAATDHKLKFFEKGATPNVIVTVPPEIQGEKFRMWKKLMSEKSEGLDNAYTNMYMGGGSSAQVVGANLRQLDFKVTQSAGEVRICVDAGIHPAVLGVSESLQGSSLNAGNFSAARRLVSDTVFRMLWRQFCGSIETLLPPQGGARLWYDTSGIAFLQEDVTDLANVVNLQATTAHTLLAAGYIPDSVTAFIASGGDWSQLKHTQILSVQLQQAQAVTEGKGALVKGVPAQQLAPAQNGSQTSSTDPFDIQVRALLEPFVAAEEEIA